MEHDDDNNEGIIYKPRERERQRERDRDIICQTAAFVCVSLTRTQRRRGESGGDRYQNSSRARRLGGAVGDVIGFRRGVLLIPGRNTRKSQPANSSRGRGGGVCGARRFLLPIFRPRGSSSPSGAHAHIYTYTRVCIYIHARKNTHTYTTPFEAIYI